LISQYHNEQQSSKMNTTTPSLEGRTLDHLNSASSRPLESPQLFVSAFTDMENEMRTLLSDILADNQTDLDRPSSNDGSLSATTTTATTTSSSSSSSSTSSPAVAKKKKKKKSEVKPKPKRIRRPPEFKVTHVYHDYSRTSLEEYMRAHPYQKPAREMRRIKSFPRCLHDMLEDVATTHQEDVISWRPHGRAFIVHRPEVFEETILLEHFQQTK